MEQRRTGTPERPLSVSFIVFKKPESASLKHFVHTQRALPVTYSGSLAPTPGLRYTKTLEPLGSGQEVFEQAAAGLAAWAVYPAWLTLYPHHAPVREGEMVALVAGVAPVWTVSAVRIVAAQRTARRFSFTLGTLPQHAVTGLERFSVWLDADDRVWFEIAAVSRPRQLLAKVGAPVLRAVQARFAVDSVRSLRRFVGHGATDTSSF